ncbi:MAG: hypothetical protein ACE5E4_11225 [Candidatus Binatia bacterium]
MAFIEIVSPARASGETAAVYDYIAEASGGGMIGKIVQMFSLRPASMRRMMRSWELTMWSGSEPRANRELVAAAVSRFNNCHY